MSKLIGEPVKVRMKEKEPVMTAFIWRKRLYRVNQVLSWWREPAEWWHGKAIRFFVRVKATGAGTGAYELYRPGNETGGLLPSINAPSRYLASNVGKKQPPPPASQ